MQTNDFKTFLTESLKEPTYEDYVEALKIVKQYELNLKNQKLKDDAFDVKDIFYRDYTNTFYKGRKETLVYKSKESFEREDDYLFAIEHNGTWFSITGKQKTYPTLDAAKKEVVAILKRKFSKV